MKHVETIPEMSLLISIFAGQLVTRANLVNVSFSLLQDFYWKYFQTNRDVV